MHSFTDSPTEQKQSKELIIAIISTHPLIHYDSLQFLRAFQSFFALFDLVVISFLA